MFQKGKQTSNIKIQIKISDLKRYLHVTRDILDAIKDWSWSSSQPIDSLHIDLLVTDDILLASTEWNGLKTIIFLGDKHSQAKVGIIVSVGNNVYSIIKSLMSKM
jgi:hypothetical protein